MVARVQNRSRSPEDELPQTGPEANLKLKEQICIKQEQ